MQLKDYSDEISCLLQGDAMKVIEVLQDELTSNDLISFCREEKITPTVIHEISTYVDKLPQKEQIFELQKQHSIDFLKKVRALFLILKKLDSAKIDYVILKGISVSFFYPSPEMRFFSDLDVLVDETNIHKTYKILKQCGFKYAKPGILDSTEGSRNYSRHLPEMINDENVIIELHHRVTSPVTYKICPLVDLCMKNKVKKIFYGTSVNILPPDLAFAVLAYHGVDQFKKPIELRFLFDLNMTSMHLNKDEIALIEKYKKILNNDEIEKSLKCLKRAKNQSGKRKTKFFLKPHVNLSARHFARRLKLIFHQISYEKQVSMKNPLFIYYSFFWPFSKIIKYLKN